MNLIFIYLIVQGHAISPFATFGKYFLINSGRKMDSVSKTKLTGSVTKSIMDGHVECGRISVLKRTAQYRKGALEVELLPWKTGVQDWTFFEIDSRDPNGPADFISFLATLLF